MSILVSFSFADTPQDQCPPECVTDTLEIVTWYPSPYSEYEELRLYPKTDAEESLCDSSDKLGLMYYNKSRQVLKVCWQDPDNLSYSWKEIALGQSGHWELSGDDISNSNTGNVGIGITTPSSKFTVNGIVEITGVGNGIKFPDGTIQTTASTATAYSRKQEFTDNGTFVVTAAEIGRAHV